MTYEGQIVMLIRSLAADLQLRGVDPQLRQVETRLALELVAPFDEINRQGRQTWGRRSMGSTVKPSKISCEA